ncbi:MAG: hypothetical protein MK101_02980 [Phycisphaerales bacterium]|nr:hypothetical protein [Phycisphaerales bacterium]
MAQLVALLLWLGLVVCPAIGFLLSAPGATHDVALHETSSLVGPTLLWIGLVSLGAVGVGRCVAPALQGRGRLLVALCLASALLPTAAVFWTWYALLDAQSVIGAAAIEGGWTWLLRRAVLAAALISTTWPLAALLLAGMPLRGPDSLRSLQRLDGVSIIGRVKAATVREWPGLLAATGLCAAAVSMATTAFDLAAEATASTELRARLALGGGLSQVAGVWALSMAPALFGAIGAWWAMSRRRYQGQRTLVPQGKRSRIWPAIVALALTLALPLATLLWLGVAPDMGIVRATIEAVIRAVGVGLLAAATVFVFVPLLRQGRYQRLVSVGALIWLTAALLPRAWVAAGWGRLQQWLPVEFADLGLGRAAALLLPAGAIALLVSAMIVRTQPRAQRDLRALDAPPWWHLDPTMIKGLISVIALGATWSLFAPAVEARLAPPGQGPPLVSRLVDAMHYQRPESVVTVLWAVALLAIAGGLIAAWRPMRSAMYQVGPLSLLICMGVWGGGCAIEPESEGTPPLQVRHLVGGPGTDPGRFVTPRAADATGHAVVVVDRSGRLQRFEWSSGEAKVVQHVDLPLKGNGFPTGVHLGDDGHALIADTHGGRVLQVTPTGEITTVVEAEATGLVSPTDVAPGPEGLIYVSEYGSVDRILVCSPDGALVRVLGQSGGAPGEFRRPQALAFDASGGLWVADACNHRLQRLDPKTGEALQIIEAGVRYPYGLDVLPSGDLLVSEYGGNVVRRIDPETGRSRVWGGWGDGVGQLRTPWSVAIDHDAQVAWVVDTGHDQVVAVDLEALAW